MLFILVNNLTELCLKEIRRNVKTAIHNIQHLSNVHLHKNILKSQYLNLKFEPWKVRAIIKVE